MARYTQTCPVIFGEGAAKEAGNEAKALGITKAIIITDEIISKTDGYKTCIGSLTEAGIEAVEFTKCILDPPSDIVHDASRMAKNAGVNGVIGIGGGSAMDTAKGVNVLFNNPEPVTQYFGAPPKFPGYPLICIPTTAGTGSEVTVIGVLTNSQTGQKGPAVFSRAALAILDPVMTVTAPPKVTAETGMDAFSHAAECMSTKKENPRSDLLALEAIRLITKSLPRAFDDGSDIKARADMLIASNFAGIAFNDANVLLGHAIAHSAGTRFSLPHGLCCALALPEAMKYSAKIRPEKIKMVGEAMGLSFVGNESPEEIGGKVADACIKLLKRVKIPSFKEMGIQRDDLLGTADLVMSDICFTYMPVPISREEVLGYLGAVYDNY